MVQSVTSLWRVNISMHITNVVSTTTVNTCLDLQRIVLQNSDIVYRPQRFTAAVWRHKRINGTLLVFPNGKLIHLGRPDGEAPRVHIRRYARILQKQNHPVQLSPIRLVTMSAVHKLSGPVDPRVVAQELNGTFEPELINTVIVKRPGYTLSIFYNGTVVITGLRDPDLIYPAFLELELLTS